MTFCHCGHKSRLSIELHRLGDDRRVVAGDEITQRWNLWKCQPPPGLVTASARSLPVVMCPTATADITARVIGQRLSDRLGQQFIVKLSRR
jgi:hypothetical protein